jgi:hypothetical protein
MPTYSRDHRFLVLSFFFPVLEFELEASHLLDRCSTTWTTPPAQALYTCKNQTDKVNADPWLILAMSNIYRRIPEPVEEKFEVLIGHHG